MYIEYSLGQIFFLITFLKQSGPHLTFDIKTTDLNIRRKDK